VGLCGLRIGQTLDPRPRYMCPAVLEPVVGFVVGRWASSRGINEMVLWEALVGDAIANKQRQLPSMPELDPHSHTTHTPYRRTHT